LGYLANGGSFLGIHEAVDLNSITGVRGIQTFIMTGYFGSHGSIIRAGATGTAVLGH
jgi:hypothetical protein